MRPAPGMRRPPITKPGPNGRPRTYRDSGVSSTLCEKGRPASAVVAPVDIGSLFKLSRAGRRFALPFPPPVLMGRNRRGPIRRQTANRAGARRRLFAGSRRALLPQSTRARDRRIAASNRDTCASRGAKKTAARIATDKPRQHQKANEASGRNPSTASGDDGREPREERRIPHCRAAFVPGPLPPAPSPRRSTRS